ncbi:MULTISPECIES: hypothetical protein [Clostridia]|uniref:hypothetical protein n=1 Tax=Clostridia TaxID=186801 RepID=UPI000EA0E4BD|nr:MULTISPECIES: hypothetical protein [Clostridia]NBJ71018.1 hypothetical protein [Roseburia sp. 1XD42-34]RKI75453.1 hypothetical protein D7V87_16380 [Clostridium sp. 1xD42-85]
MANLSMFLLKDQEKADKQLAVYDYNFMHAARYVAQGEFEKAAVHHRNVANALEELQRMKNSKDTTDEARSLLNQIDKQESIRRNWF